MVDDRRLGAIVARSAALAAPVTLTATLTVGVATSHIEVFYAGAALTLILGMVAAVSGRLAWGREMKLPAIGIVAIGLVLVVAVGLVLYALAWRNWTF